MIRRIYDWICRQRQWRREHEAAWARVTVSGDEPNAFQLACEEELDAALGRLGRTLSERIVSIGPFGEPMIHAQIPDSPLQVWIYSDGAEVVGAGEDRHFERWDWRTPSELQAAFIEAVVQAMSTVARRPA